jgi:PBP1b-binding outer membrane lipoprotein LpoB
MKAKAKWILAAGMITLLTGAGSAMATTEDNTQAQTQQAPQATAEVQAEPQQPVEGGNGKMMRKHHAGKKGMGMHHMIGMKGDHEELAKFLNLTAEELREKHKAGLSLAEIAKEQGITEEALKNFMIEQHNKHLEEMKKNFEEHVGEMINAKPQFFHFDKKVELKPEEAQKEAAQQMQ